MALMADGVIIGAPVSAVIRGEERPDRWVPPVGVREREGGRALVLGCGCGEDGPRVGRFGRFGQFGRFLFFFTANLFPFSVFTIEFKTTPKTLTKI